MSVLPKVSVLVPTFQEAEDIVGCLEAIGDQDYPSRRLEVIIIDGGSADGTLELATQALDRWPFASALGVPNDRLLTSSNLNVGLARSTGEVVCRVDARTRIEPHYVSTCVKILTSRSDVAVVGGAQRALRRDGSARATGIARALNNRWSMGGSPYRRDRVSGPSDTVYLGSFRRRDLVEVGGWDEALVSNQDFELNRRMSRLGSVWFEASLQSGYLPRTSLGALWRQYVRFGRAKVRYWRYAGDRPQPRQWLLIVAPPLGVTAAGAVLARLSPAGCIAFAVVAALGALLVEARGTTGPDGGASARVVAVAGMATVAVGWWWGVAREGVRRHGARDGSDAPGVAS